MLTGVCGPLLWTSGVKSDLNRVSAFLMTANQVHIKARLQFGKRNRVILDLNLEGLQH